MAKYIFIHCLTLALAPTLGLAQISECEGKWTNQPCSSPTRSIDEKPHVPLSEEQIARLKKDKLITDFKLRSDNLKYRRKIESLETQPAIDFCNREDTSFDSCADKLAKVDEQLSRLVAEAEAVKNEKDKIETERERNRIEQERNEIEASKPPARIIINNP